MPVPVEKEGHPQEKRRSFEQPPFTVELTTDPVLETIVAQVRQTPFDWNRINRAFKQTAIYQRGGYGEPGNLCGYLLETHCNLVLEDFVPGLKQVKLDPIQQGDKTEHYFFRKHQEDSPEIVASKRQSRKDFAEYDRLMLIHEKNSETLPVVWEVKLVGPNERLRRSGDERSIIGSQSINTILKPLVEYFQTKRFGFVLCQVYDTVNFHDNLQLKTFRKIGGILVDFPITSLEFKLQVLGLKGKL